MMSYRVRAVITNKENGEQQEYQLFGDNEMPTSFRIWLESLGIEFDDELEFGVSFEEPTKENGFDGFCIEPVSVDPVELLKQVCKVSENEYLQMLREGKNPFEMNYPCDKETQLETSFGQSMLDLLGSSVVFNWYDFLEWGREMGIYSNSSIYPVSLVSDWDEKVEFGICGW